MACVITLPYPPLEELERRGFIDRARADARQYGWAIEPLLEGAGGKQYRISGPTPIGGFDAVLYLFPASVGKFHHLEITKKPLVLSCSRVEKELRNLLDPVVLDEVSAESSKSPWWRMKIQPPERHHPGASVDPVEKSIMGSTILPGLGAIAAAAIVWLTIRRN